MRGGFKEYGQRNALLKRLGWKNYQHYLESDLWKKIRAKQLRDFPNCHACRGKATQVHHGKYTLLNLLGHSPEYLFSICAGCHFASEFTRDDRKRTVNRATKALKTRRHRITNYQKWICTALLRDDPDNMDTQYRRRLEREV